MKKRTEQDALDSNKPTDVLGYLISNKVGVNVDSEGRLSVVCDSNQRREIEEFIMAHKSEIMRLYGQQKKPLIVSINDSESSAPPVFCVHAIAGTVYKYMKVASRLAPQCKVYGIQSCLFVDSNWTNHSVIDMAELYVQEIRKIQPTGPYRLLGWSFGGIVAIEMERILNSLGEKVSFLGLIDSYIQPRYEPLTEDQLKDSIHDHIVSNFPGLDADVLAQNIAKQDRTSIRDIVSSFIDNEDLGKNVTDWIENPPAYMFSRAFSTAFCQAYVDSILALENHELKAIHMRPTCWWDKNKCSQSIEEVERILGVLPKDNIVLDVNHSQVLSSEKLIVSVAEAISSLSDRSLAHGD
ncbi:thioesterase domain-containing protein [Pseudoalteromonas umbrosa]|uniref:thioesterase domain-containing protein n=1 Tax=Pseudoalteromonas umbrosa TaxID=3048489 RepID=UPI0024C34DFA|nr:thioesterase domain-containing protein [Pseudoalteromonas sp. B95]MDK1288223.1 thioesterase domain-containing protein [Pseudoalteromonas sp. B95]